MTVMTQWRIGSATLSFHVPSRENVEHVESRERDDEATWNLSPETEAFTGNGETYHSYDPAGCWDTPGHVVHIEHRLWWWHVTACTGGYECSCGPLTLLEALERLDPSERGTAVRLHADEMRALYDHFWSGQGLVSGSCSNIGDACVSCIAEGAAHVWDVYEDACLLAEEFGEALAAYAYELMVGEPRFHPQSPAGAAGTDEG